MPLPLAHVPHHLGPLAHCIPTHSTSAADEDRLGSAVCHHRRMHQRLVINVLVQRRALCRRNTSTNGQRAQVLRRVRKTALRTNPLQFSSHRGSRALGLRTGVDHHMIVCTPAKLGMRLSVLILAVVCTCLSRCNVSSLPRTHALARAHTHTHINLHTCVWSSSTSVFPNGTESTICTLWNSEAESNITCKRRDE